MIKNKNILLKIFKNISINNKNFKLSKNLLKKISFFYDENFYIYCDFDSFEILKKFKNRIKKEIENSFKRKSNLFIKIKLERVHQEVENKNLIKIINKKHDFVLHSNNELILHIIKKKIFNNNENKTIFIWGSNGIGKSSIILYLLNEFKFELINKKIFYISFYQFINEYNEYLKDEEKMVNLFKKYEVFIFDDFHFLKNKKLLNKLIYSICLNKKVIFLSTNDKNPLVSIDENFMKLIENGNILKINSPNIFDIKKIIYFFVKKKNIKITVDSIDYLSSILGSNITFLIDRLFKIFLFFENNMNFKIIDLKNLKKNLNNISFFNKKNKIINLKNNENLKMICDKLNFNINEILSASRKKEIILKRDIIIFIFKKKMNFSHEFIAKTLNKNHSTISYSIKKIVNKMKNENFKNYINILIENKI